MKTFLIVLFAALNIFLIVFSTCESLKNSHFGEETVEGTIKILEEKNIILDKDKIPEKQVNLNNLELKNAVLTHDFPSGFNRCGEKEFLLEIPGSVKNEGEAKRLLSKIGIKNNVKIMYADGERAEAALYIKNYPVFDVSVSLVQNKDSVTVSGSWYVPAERPKESRDMTDIVSLTGILVDFSNIAGGKEKITVEKIELGYYIPDSSRNIERLKATALPCWHISVSDGREYYFNAQNGEVLKK